jgi:hypothetical protein
MPLGRLKKFSVEKDEETGSYTVAKKGLLSSSSMTIGPSGVSAEKKGLLSSQSVSAGADGVSVEKNGLLSSESASVSGSGVSHEKKSLLHSESTTVGTDGSVSREHQELGKSVKVRVKGKLMSQDMGKHYTVPGETIVGARIFIVSMSETQGAATVLSFEKVGFPAKLTSRSTHTVKFENGGTEVVTLQRFKEKKRTLNPGLEWTMVL